mmetsp:Transcript_59069/g.175719  ORF Transcript_59069/g.175719 Transcript_59069/m.175719 type:complete len:96 (+) Transcript_59069:99-386(+)
MLGRVVAASMQRAAGESHRVDSIVGMFSRSITAGMRLARGTEAGMPAFRLVRNGYAPLTQAGRLPVPAMEWDLCIQQRPRLAYEQNWDSLPETPM